MGLSRFFVLITVICFHLSLFARACPSKLNTHLHDLSDSFSIGAELRAFYFGAPKVEKSQSSDHEDDEASLFLVNAPNGDGTGSAGKGGGQASDDDSAENGNWTDNYWFGVRPAFMYTPYETLSILGEADLRVRQPGWGNQDIKGFSGRLNHLTVNIDTESFTMSSGVQSIEHGTPALLDQRFLSIDSTTTLSLGKISFFGGVTTGEMLKTASNCLFGFYNKAYNPWRQISEELDNYMVGLSFQLPARIDMMYLYSIPRDNTYKSHAVSFSQSGNIVSENVRYSADVIGLLNYDKQFFPALHAVIKTASLGNTGLSMLIGSLMSFNHSATRSLIPIYENLALSFIRRYNLSNGYVDYLKLDWEVITDLKVFSHLFVQSQKISLTDTSDELDIGLNYDYKKSLQITTSAVAFDQLRNKTNYGAYLEVRYNL